MSKTVHIMCGLPGSGKSTYAKELSKKKNAELFSLDEWMVELLGENFTDEDFERFVLPCQSLIWKASKPLLAKNIDVVYDFAVYSKKGRKELFEKVRENGANIVIYYFNIPHDICKERLLTRGVPEVTAERFDKLIEYFVPPSADEGYEIINIKNA